MDDLIRRVLVYLRRTRRTLRTRPRIAISSRTYAGRHQDNPQRTQTIRRNQRWWRWTQ